MIPESKEMQGGNSYGLESTGTIAIIVKCCFITLDTSSGGGGKAEGAAKSNRR